MGPGSAWRREFMSRWTQIAGGRAVIALSRQGDVVGCGCRRPAVAEADHQLVGPLYADTLDVARQLVHALTCDVAGHNVSINIWYKSYAKRGSAAEWLACWTQAQKGLGSNRSRDAVG